MRLGAASTPLPRHKHAQTTTKLVIRWWNDIVAIKRALNVGSYGVLVPWVNNKEEAKLADATRNDVHRQVAEQQRMIDDMQKSLEAINRRDTERAEWEKLKEAEGNG